MHLPTLLSKYAIRSATSADCVVYVLHRLGGEWCMHQGYFLGRLVGVVLWILSHIPLQ